MHTNNGHKILFSLIFYLLGLHALPGAAKDIPISTPLMDFVRQKRAAKGPRVLFFVCEQLLKYQSLFDCPLSLY